MVAGPAPLQQFNHHSAFFCKLLGVQLYWTIHLWLRGLNFVPTIAAAVGFRVGSLWPPQALSFGKPRLAQLTGYVVWSYGFGGLSAYEPPCTHW